MISDKIPYSKISFFSAIVQDYLVQNTKLVPFYNRHNSIANYLPQILEKEKQNINRDLLFEVLKNQNNQVQLSSRTKNNIESLVNKNTFTVTTGHQLCLFSGPLYCIYKIISAINLSQSLNEKYPSYHFVPLFWMASEDHDFEEVNHINLYGKKIEWNNSQSGAVGRMNLSGIDGVLEELFQLMGEGENAEAMKQMVLNAYASENSLAQATRIFLNELFKEDGLVIIDGDDARLKQQILPLIKNDVSNKRYYPILQEKSNELAIDYSAQAYVREINFFSLEKNQRTRIEQPVNSSDIEQSPERFSPNVLMRPLYQESVLPNVAYVGGGAEIAYWMQLKGVFELENIPFPILVLRNSALVISKKHNERLKSLGFTSLDLFKSELELHNQYISGQNDEKSSDREFNIIFGKIYEELKKTYSNPVQQQIIDAEQQRHKKSLENMLKKLTKVDKQKHKNALDQISKIKKQYFPNNALQERHENLIAFYLNHGDNFIKKMKEELNPLDSNFVVLAL
ncbi:bacillithiol biosynthesis cysteine-adding enzyme BshC [Flavobacteriales bacterium]|nr:bacillithiol biosynthesis cysteine-adding enzyme BshC [Flavobacteriales bacterium]